MKTIFHCEWTSCCYCDYYISHHNFFYLFIIQLWANLLLLRDYETEERNKQSLQIRWKKKKTKQSNNRKYNTRLRRIQRSYVSLWSTIKLFLLCVNISEVNEDTRTLDRLYFIKKIFFLNLKRAQYKKKFSFR